MTPEDTFDALKYKIVREEDGSVLYFNWLGELHREDNLPAVDRGPNGTKEWWVNGKRHRENGQPAVITSNGKRFEYWVNGVLHRENDQPAVISPLKEEWWYNGERSRDTGYPAVIWAHGANPHEYWLDGVQIK